MNINNAEILTVDDLIQFASGSGRSTALTISITDELYEQLEMECNKLSKTKSAFIKQLFINYLKENYLQKHLL